MIEHNENDIDNWLVDYANRSEDIETTLQNLSIYYRNMKMNYLKSKSNKK